MAPNRAFIIEGLDRLGKDTLINGLLHTLGHHQTLHFSKPVLLDCYAQKHGAAALKAYQEATFRNLFRMLKAPGARIICNRSHIGECVYAPIYRKYPGDYVFDLESEEGIAVLSGVRLILLTEDFETSSHFVEDGKSLGGGKNRQAEQAQFLLAFNKSAFSDKRSVCVTDSASGGFRPAADILREVLG
jgi:hypothetical protein